MPTLRFSLQKRLRALGLSTAAATASRFVFAAPLALACTVAVSVVCFGERPSGREGLGIALLAASIVGIVLSA